MNIAENIFHILEHEARLRVIYEKMEFLRLGSIRDIDINLNAQKPYQWTKDPVKNLGMWLTNDDSNLFNLNTTQQLQMIDNLIKIWNTKNIKLYGRVIIVKTLLISQLIYYVNCLHINNPSFTKLQAKLNSFVWSNKKHFFKKEIYAPKEKGGLDMINLECFFRTIKLNRINRLSVTPDWYKIIFNNSIDKNFWKYDIGPTDFKRHNVWCMPFWSKCCSHGAKKILE